MKKLFLILLLCAPLFLAGCSRQPSRYDTFADCLTESGAKMYGTDWCPHCKNQKKLFGSSFDKVDYINCERNQKKCKEAGIKGYPTWIFKDGSGAAGTQQLKTLADRTNCQLSKLVSKY